MIFKIYDCDFGIKYNGQNYDFPHVKDLTVEDPEKNSLTRGSNASNKLGIAYKEGIKDPKKVNVTILGMDATLKAVLDTIYAGQARIDVYTVNRNDGSSKIYKNAILTNSPQQMKIDDSVDSMDVALNFESFDQVENHKS